jgi:hypothetical protein
MSAREHLKRDANHAQERVEAERIGTKVCPKCSLKLLVEDFDIDESKADGRKSWCQTCRETDRIEKQNRALSDNEGNVRRLIDKIDAGVLLTLSEAQPGGTNVPHRVQLLEEIIALMGGVRGVAMQYVATFQAAPPGSAIRQRLLDKLVNAVHLSSEGGGVSKPRELMSDEELEREIAKRAIRLAQDTLPDVETA